MTEMLTIAIQKSGRLSEKTLQLFVECGIKLENNSKDRLKSKALNFPATVLHLRDDDIPECINDGVADAGIVGENVILEKMYPLEIAYKLGFARCHLSLALPVEKEFSGLESLHNIKLATSYPNILKRFLDKNNIPAVIHEISGSVEIAPEIGLADGVFDIVSTGKTLHSHGLREVYQVMESEAVLATMSSLSTEKRKILNKLQFRISAVQQARNHKYIVLNAPNDSIEAICNILPGMKSPTITPLAMSGWSSLYSVIKEDEFWENIDKLKKAGAQGILVLPIEKMIL